MLWYVISMICLKIGQYHGITMVIRRITAEMGDGYPVFRPTKSCHSLSIRVNHCVTDRFLVLLFSWALTRRWILRILIYYQYLIYIYIHIYVIQRCTNSIHLAVPQCATCQVPRSRHRCEVIPCPLCASEVASGLVAVTGCVAVLLLWLVPLADVGCELCNREDS
jgi:hypothetical protein